MMQHPSNMTLYV